ncbi:hypothetical protein MMC14_002063 [Varicellaria rhodocarpa]|nr:hypothetical protein [Varicellaria rhodocarpa]
MPEQRSQPMASFGRGGAGNISSAQDSLPPDLVTPTIKSNMYTTGRGGQGNMAKNNPYSPKIARESQDVVAPPRRLSQGDFHYGRGGAANVLKMTAEEIAQAKEGNARREREMREQVQRKTEPKE